MLSNFQIRIFFPALVALSLMTVAGEARADDGDPCAPIYAQIDAGYESWVVDADERWFPYIVRASRRARACDGGRDFKQASITFRFETWALGKMGRHQEALPTYDRYARLATGRVDSLAMSRIHTVRSWHTRSAGLMVEYVQDAARALLYAPAANLAARGELTMDLAEAYHQLGDKAAAARMYDSVARSYDTRTDDVRLRKVLARALLMKAYVAMDLYDPVPLDTLRQSVETSSRAMALSDETSDGSLISEYIVAVLVRSEAYRRLGMFEESLRDADLGLKLALGDRGDNYRRLQAWINRADVMLAWKRYPEALADFATGIAFARRVNDPYFEQLMETRRAVTYEQMGRLQDAEMAFGRANEAVEKHRSQMRTTEWAAHAFSAWERTYRGLIRVQLKQGRFEDAFRTLDMTRARGLRDLRAVGRMEVLKDEGLRREVEAIDKQIASLHDQLSGEVAGSDAHVQLQSELVVQRVRKFELLGIGAPEAHGVSLAEVQRGLAGRNQTLLTYFVEDSLAYAFVVRPDTFAALPLATSGADIREQMEAISPAWAFGGSEPQASDTQFETAPLKQLYDMLFAPVRHIVPAGVPLVVIPDGSLALLPFSLLLEEDPGRFQYSKGRFLIHRHPISTELAAALLLEPARSRHASLDLLAVGRSRFGEVEGTERARSTTRSGTLGDLPFVSAEIDHLRRLFPRGRFALDEPATEGFLREYLRDARVLHLASHAALNESLPLYSFIQLSPDREDDGALYLYELSMLDLGAELVVLSGCSTARGLPRTGEGLMGLQYAFRAAGAGSTLATLWQVDDRATVFLMERFYHHIRRGMEKDSALQQAQIEYLAQHSQALASPFYWAAPVLYGDIAPLGWSVPLYARMAPSMWMLLGLALVVGAFAGPRLWRRSVARRDP
jgi:CHAT domain-containing protein/tetratricopeptide (TPR) repeat protein